MGISSGIRMILFECHCIIYLYYFCTMKQKKIEISHAIARNPLVRFEKPVDFLLSEEEHLAIVGPNGAGKSLLVDLLMGKHSLKEGKVEYNFFPSPTNTVYENIKYIAFRDTYGSADASYYYQQRWNATDQEDAPIAREMLGEISDPSLFQRLLQLFQLEAVIDKKIILLSSGELRKFQLIKALLSTPRILIIDNPFIGLDAQTRELLQLLLEELSTLEHLQIIMVLSRVSDIPGFITHVVPVKDKVVSPKQSREEYMSEDYAIGETDKTRLMQQQISQLPDTDSHATGKEMVKLNQVSIRYGDRTILKELDWTVQTGEKWALSGENGAGKSTLLSLICADNPQAYACDISLFGRKRGTGESIWEIKKHIGYVSPEMHRAYLKNIPSVEIVASGLHDSIGLYKQTPSEQIEKCKWWMTIFNTGHLSEVPFLQLSSGEQRLVLLARAFVKDPELLILDEPFHGLDSYNRLHVKKAIEAFCGRKNKTLIMVTHYQNEFPSVITHHLHLTKN